MNAGSDMTMLERERLERRANQIRSRLLRTVERLDQKRQNLTKLTDVKYQIESHAAPLAAGAAVAMIAVGSVITLAAVHAMTAPQRLRAERTRALKRAWNHPERVGQTSKGSFVLGLGRTMLEGLVTTAAIELIKRAMKNPPAGARTRLRAKLAPPVVPIVSATRVAMTGVRVPEVERISFDDILPASPSDVPRPPRD